LDAEREARGYNNSIYLMAGMPYLLVGGLGLLIYRGYRRRAKEMAQQAPSTGAATGGIGHVLSPLPADWRSRWRASESGKGGIGHVLPTLPADPSQEVDPGRSDR
jgi:hypothetical protein